ncbi:coiled-coil domain-containing protein 18 [Fopius arisanus]|uniref:Coiled-coil domain-containing protein 18 n=1 Tax=Fopius arisanus TaxID=64838 RepID=A0A9R1T549_9HYME|nr:PREDICTED: coiled-coil domain-containing protein 18-like [Fopius arisanus]
MRKRITKSGQKVTTKFLRRFTKSSKSLGTPGGDSNGPSQRDMQNISSNVEISKAQLNEITPDEVIRLRQQVRELTEKITRVENENQVKDVHLENLRSDNERIVLEIKKQQRCNRNLKQQLDDERFFYEKEKEHFSQEMERHRIKCAGSTSKLHLQQYRELERMREALQEENKEIREELLVKNQTTYNLCIKFLRMKDARDVMRVKLDCLLRDHLHVIAEMMEKLDEAREELNIIVAEKFQDPLPISKAKFLQVVQRNSRLVYENATLKVHIQQLTLNIEKLKSHSQKPKLIDVDTRTIAKLSVCSSKKRSNERGDFVQLPCKHESSKLLKNSQEPKKSHRIKTERKCSEPGIIAKFSTGNAQNTPRGTDECAGT